MKKTNKILSIVLVVCTLALSLVVPASAAPVVYSQRDSKWSDYNYGKGDTGLKNDKATIGTSGCMLLSVTNAVYYLNGKFLEPTMLADYALRKKCRVNYSGTADCFVSHMASEYGSRYGFRYAGSVSNEKNLKAALQQGKVAIWHTKGHIMSVVDYDSSNNKYLVLNSEVRTKTKKAYTWITYSTMKAYNTAGKGFMLLESTISAQKKTGTGSTTISWPTTQNIQVYAKSTGNNTTVYQYATSSARYGTIYAEDLVTVLGGDGARLKVKYPVTNSRGKITGYKMGYVKKSDITDAAFNKAITKWTASSQITTYRRKGGGAKFGYISRGDVCYTISGRAGEWEQVLYPISGNAYKMGWIKR